MQQVRSAVVVNAFAKLSWNGKISSLEILGELCKSVPSSVCPSVMLSYRKSSLYPTRDLFVAPTHRTDTADLTQYSLRQCLRSSAASLVREAHLIAKLAKS